MELFKDGRILDGVGSFGEDGKNEGVNDGLFSCFIGAKGAPKGGSRRAVVFWSDGTERKR